MSVPFARRPPTLAVSESRRPALALDCAQNVFAAVDRRAPEARALVEWLAENAAALGLDDASVPEAGGGLGRPSRGGVTLADWHKAEVAINAAAVLPMLDDAPIRCWAEAIGDALEFDPVSTRILSLALHYVLDKRVERLMDALSQCRGNPTRLNRDPSLFALLLQTSTAEIATRLAGGARLLSSGLLQLDRQGGLEVHNRLVSLIRQGTLPAADFYDQLLGSSQPEPLPWDAFSHLGQAAEIAASVLQAAVAGRECGISVLLYGPPGTGKTSFYQATSETQPSAPLKTQPPPLL